ncbi:MAG: phage tail fiber protein [Beijerinckiaceae bacterium]
MADATNTFENLIALHLFNNASIPNMGDATGMPAAATAGSFYISAHTADPGEAGNQTTSEAAYTGYARIAVARAPAGWTVTGGIAANTAALTFPAPTAAPGGPITHLGIGMSASGAGTLMFKKAVTSAYQPIIGTAPPIAAGAVTNETL